MEDNINTTIESQEQPKKHKTILTILRVLMIVSGILTVSYSTYNYFTFDKTYPEKMEILQNTLSQLSDSGIDSGSAYNSAVNGISTLAKKAQNVKNIKIAINLLFGLITIFYALMIIILEKKYKVWKKSIKEVIYFLRH